MRVGLTSATRMLKDVSIASMIEDRAHGSVSGIVGRAVANSSSEQAIRRSAAGTCRRHVRLDVSRMTPRLL